MGMFPGVETPGYSQDVPPGQRNVAAAFSAKQTTRFISRLFDLNLFRGILME